MLQTGNRDAAAEFGIGVVAEGIEDQANNTTRFVVLATPERAAKISGDDKTSIMFGVQDRPGALYDCLLPFMKPASACHVSKAVPIVAKLGNTFSSLISLVTKKIPRWQKHCKPWHHNQRLAGPGQATPRPASLKRLGLLLCGLSSLYVGIAPIPARFCSRVLLHSTWACMYLLRFLCR